MKKKYYKDAEGKWRFVTITDEEEKELLRKFIGEYAELLNMIEEMLNKSHQKYVEALFNKIATPTHFKFEEILSRRRDEAKYQKTSNL